MKKAHQRIIREKMSNEECHNLFGSWWEDINVDISNTIVKTITS